MYFRDEGHGLSSIPFVSARCKLLPENGIL